MEALLWMYLVCIYIHVVYCRVCKSFEYVLKILHLDFVGLEVHVATQELGSFYLYCLCFTKLN